MELWGTILLAGLLSVAAFFYVVWPLLRKVVPPYVEEDERLTELISRKDGVLKAIKDVEFDYHTGKLTQEDYERFDARLRRQAIAYIQQIEKLAPTPTMSDEELEAEINRYRRTPAKPKAPAPAINDDALEAEISRYRKSQAPATGPANGNGHAKSEPASSQESPRPRFCTECGNTLTPGNKFCGECGAPVAAKPEAVSQV
jgi:hypothetical protein